MAETFAWGDRAHLPAHDSPSQPVAGLDSLQQLIYVSAAPPGIRNDELEMILRSARRRNAVLHVTGLLMLIDSTFCQVLEGGAENVDSLYRRIGRDRRHSNVRLLLRKPIPVRSFPDWSMGPVTRALGEFQQAPDIDHFFAGIKPPFYLMDSEMRRILERFHEGAFAQRWTSGAPDDQKPRPRTVQFG